MSETPRVDRVHWNHAYLKEESYKLERELNAANERIKRLEEAGDAMATYAHIIDFQNWKEAKEPSRENLN